VDNNIYYRHMKQHEGQSFIETKSAAGKLLHYKLLDVQEGKVTIELTVTEQIINPFGGLHGGIYALIMDECVGLAFYTICNGELYTTVNLNVEHLWSAMLGEVITATGQVIRYGKKIAYTEGEIRNAKGDLICRATSNLINTGKEVPLL
jgi:acyl-coenzyme A thioesterase 13